MRVFKLTIFFMYGFFLFCTFTFANEDVESNNSSEDGYEDTTLEDEDAKQELDFIMENLENFFYDDDVTISATMTYGTCAENNDVLEEDNENNVEDDDPKESNQERIEISIVKNNDERDSQGERELNDSQLPTQGPFPPPPPNTRCNWCVSSKVIKKNSKARCPRGVRACAHGTYKKRNKLCAIARKNIKKKLPKGCKVKWYRKCIGACYDI